MSLDLNTIIPSVVRSVAVAAVGVPVALSTSGVLGAGSSYLNSQALLARSANNRVVFQNNVKTELTDPCLDFLLSAAGSKAERASQDGIDEYFGNEMNHREVCRWVFQ